MKKLIAAIAAVFLSSSAFAANLALPTKAPAPFDPVASGGWYVGLGSFLETQKATIGDTSLLSQSGSIGAIGGYGHGNGQSWWQLQAEAYFRNLNGSGFCGLGTSCSVSSNFTGAIWMKVGGPVASTLLGALPQLGNLFPGLSPTTVAANVFPYIAGGVVFNDVSSSIGLANARAWTVPLGLRLGMITKLTNGTVSDVGAEVDLAGSGLAIGGAKVPQGPAYKAYLHFAFSAL
jgi:hypothetical protein